MIGHAAALLFWISAGLLGYSYFLYPLLVMGLARLRPAQSDRPAWRQPPQVAVVIAAYNEEKHIAARIGNILAQDYPAGMLSLVVGSDGSTDATVARASAAADERVTIHEFSRNRGKASVLNDLVATTSAEILVFSDANTRFEPDTVSRLVARLADPGVGAVSGELLLTPPDRGRNDDHRYWSLEQRLKAAESRLDGLLGANGGVYAIRRSLYVPLSPETICDDFVIAMNVAVAGNRVVYEPLARAHEETPDDMQAEFRRRVRIGTGNYQALFQHPAFLTDTSWPRRWTYFSHKVLRWISPHLLALMLLASIILAGRRSFAILLGAQLVAYLGAWLVYASRRAIGWPAIMRSGSLFFVVNAAFAAAFVRFLGGNYTGGWLRTAR
jgi:cellulose synthase/poly-beta-1,6-N-acetylglucosamine synthase-like glycosyltransferase